MVLKNDNKAALELGLLVLRERQIKTFAYIPDWQKVNVSCYWQLQRSVLNILLSVAFILCFLSFDHVGGAFNLD